MGLKKQAAYLTATHLKNALARTTEYKYAARNRLIIQLTVLAGLRAKEVAGLRWEHILDGSGEVADAIRLTDDISKGRSGGLIALGDTLKDALVRARSSNRDRRAFVITSERGGGLKTQSIINLLRNHYQRCGIEGASSHSGRRTFITNAARKISLVGGSMRDVQALARHSNLTTTQRYVEQNNDAQKAVVNLI